MSFYVGLDISQRKTAICVVNGKGKILAEGSSLTSRGVRETSGSSQVQRP